MAVSILLIFSKSNLADFRKGGPHEKVTVTYSMLPFSEDLFNPVFFLPNVTKDGLARSPSTGRGRLSPGLG